MHLEPSIHQNPYPFMWLTLMMQTYVWIHYQCTFHVTHIRTLIATSIIYIDHMLLFCASLHTNHMILVRQKIHFLAHHCTRDGQIVQQLTIQCQNMAMSFCVEWYTFYKRVSMVYNWQWFLCVASWLVQQFPDVATRTGCLHEGVYDFVYWYDIYKQIQFYIPSITVMYISYTTTPVFVV